MGRHKNNYDVLSVFDVFSRDLSTAAINTGMGWGGGGDTFVGMQFEILSTIEAEVFLVIGVSNTMLGAFVCKTKR